jgi:hypothetical protein
LVGTDHQLTLELINQKFALRQETVTEANITLSPIYTLMGKVDLLDHTHIIIVTCDDDGVHFNQIDDVSKLKRIKACKKHIVKRQLVNAISELNSLVCQAHPASIYCGSVDFKRANKPYKALVIALHENFCFRSTFNVPAPLLISYRFIL